MKYLRIPVIVANLIAACLLILSASAWYISPETSTIPAYLGMVFPFFIVANFLFLILWLIIRRWKLVIASIIPLIMCISPLFVYFPIHFKTKEIPLDCIKLMSYNVKAFDWSIKLKAETSPIIQYIKENDPDIVCLQEFMSADRSKDRNIKAIRQVLDQYPYFSVTDLWPSMQGYTYGLACFSKYPIISTEQIPLDSEVNGAVVYKIKVNGKIIHIINNHLESNRLTAVDKKLYQDLLKDANRQSIDNAMHNIKDKLGSAFQKRAPQADIISNWVKKWGYDTPIIVCGDFNDTPISYTYRKIKNNLVDSYASTGFGPGITYHENHFWFRIDFIMHSENIKSYNTTIGKIKYSDHYPIWSYIQLP